MSDDGPAQNFVIPTETVEEVKAIVRQRIPEVLIGTKDLGDGKTFFSVTVFSRTPQILEELGGIMAQFKDKAELSGERPPADTPLSDLIAKVRQAQNNP